VLSRRQRVLRALEVARPFGDPSTEDGETLRVELQRQGTLSPGGVDLALTLLDTSPSDDHLDTMLGSTERSRCIVSLAGNVCIAALRAIVVALAVAPEVLIRPSRRDPTLATTLVRRMKQAGLNIELIDRIDASPGDEVHLYGSDATLQTLSETLPAGAVVRSFGSGFGVATAIPDDANALARSLIPFDGAGCLSPRVAITSPGSGDTR